MARLRASEVTIRVDGARRPEEEQPQDVRGAPFPPGSATSFELEHTQLLESDHEEVTVGTATQLKPGSWRVTVTLTRPPPVGNSAPFDCDIPYLTGGTAGQETELIFVEDVRDCVGRDGLVDARLEHNLAVEIRGQSEILQNRSMNVAVTVVNDEGQPETANVDLELMASNGARQTLYTWPPTEVGGGGRFDLPLFAWRPTCAGGVNDVAAGRYTLWANVARVDLEADVGDNSAPLQVEVIANCDEDDVPDFEADGTTPRDNCPTRTNPLQEDCDGDGIGDACDAPEIRAFAPSCGPNSRTAAESIVVIGSGFGSLLPGDVAVCGAPITSFEAQQSCFLVFRSPVDCLDSAGCGGATTPCSTGNLNLAFPPTGPTGDLQGAFCTACPGPIRVFAFHPVVGNRGTTLVTLLGCGFDGVQTAVYFEDATGTRIGASVLLARGEMLQVRVPFQLVEEAFYKIVVSRTTAPAGQHTSTGQFKVMVD